MRQVRPRIGVELLLVGTALSLLIGAFALVVSAYRKPGPAAPRPPVAVAQPPDPKPTPEPVAPPPPPPSPETVDLTSPRLREIAEAREAQARLAVETDRKAAALEVAAKDALAQAERWKSRERLIRGEVAAREHDADRAENIVDAFARERDILAAKVPDMEKSLQRAQFRAKDGVAVLPYKGPNGTWRRPIALECRADSVILQPRGRTFTIGDLSTFLNPRFNPLVLEVAKAMLRARDLASPDGMPTVPYLVFIVRPDGIRSYYAARGVLEPLGIAYGYELADADADIEFPDLDDPTEWGDGASPSRGPVWPSPSAVGVGSGSGEGRPGTGGFGTGSSPGTGPGSAGRSRAPGGIAGRGAPPGGTGRDGGSGSLVGRVLPTPGDGRGSSSSNGGWGGPSGVEDDVSGSGLAEMEAINRGAGAGSDMPRDGRVPIHPGMPRVTMPRFDPPPASSGDDGSGSSPSVPSRNRPSPSDVTDAPAGGTSVTMAPSSRWAASTGTSSASPGSGNGSPIVDAPIVVSPPGAASGGRTATGGLTPATSSVIGQSRSQSLRQAVANREGLVAPTVPNDGTNTADLATKVRDLPTPNPAGAPSTGSAAANPPNSTASSSNPSTANPATPSTSSGQPSGSTSTARSGKASASGSSSSSGIPGGNGPQDGSRINGLKAETLEMTVSCGSKGVTIYPGGQTIDLATMKADDLKLVTSIRAIIDARYDASGGLGQRPKVRFLVKPGGEAVYRKARWQVSQSGAPWPTTLQMADRDVIRLLPGDKP